MFALCVRGLFTVKRSGAGRCKQEAVTSPQLCGRAEGDGWGWLSETHADRRQVFEVCVVRWAVGL